MTTRRTRKRRSSTCPQATLALSSFAEPEWVWEQREDPAVRIIDCTTADVYQRAHLPGALRLPRRPFLKSDHDPMDHLNAPLFVIEAEDFARTMGPDRCLECDARRVVRQPE